MTVSDNTGAGTSGILQAPRRPPWLVALDLYRAGGSFRWFSEFALIGGVVLWFLLGGGWGLADLGSLWRAFKAGETSSAPASPVASDLPKVAPAKRAMLPRISDLKIEPGYFDNRPEPLRGKLVAALHAYDWRNSQRVAAALADADPDDRSVWLMGGLNLLTIPGAGSMNAGLEMLERAIEKGESRAMAILGVLKIAGLPGVPRNNAAGRELLERAVDAGDAAAARVLAECFITGSIGVVDPGRAEKYLRLASQRGDARATYRLGEMLQMGLGLPKNELEGERLIAQAANEGFDEAQAMLGVLRMMPYSHGLTDDPSEALQWFERAAAQYEPHAMFYLGMFYMEYGSRIGRLDAARAVDLFARCARATLWGQCLFAYGVALELGMGIRRDPLPAYAMYSLALMRDDATPKIKARREELGKTLSVGDIERAGQIATHFLNASGQGAPLQPLQPSKPSEEIPVFSRTHELAGQAAQQK
jgi:TPR repeat protein